MKKLVSYKVEEAVIEKFMMVASIKGKNLSTMVEEMMLEYIENNREEINNFIDNFWEK